MALLFGLGRDIDPNMGKVRVLLCCGEAALVLTPLLRVAQEASNEGPLCQQTDPEGFSGASLRHTRSLQPSE